MANDQKANGIETTSSAPAASDVSPTMERLPAFPCERCDSDKWYRSRGMYYRKCADCNPYYAPGGEGEEQMVAGRDVPAPAVEALPLFDGAEVPA